jgi:hypothetical protein
MAGPYDFLDVMTESGGRLATLAAKRPIEKPGISAGLIANIRLRVCNSGNVAAFPTDGLSTK